MAIRTLRAHRKVWLVWTTWWAVQLVLGEIGGFGVRLVATRPLLDIYLGPLTVSLGRHPIATEPDQRERFCCRGFIVTEKPVL